MFYRLGKKSEKRYGGGNHQGPPPPHPLPCTSEIDVSTSDYFLWTDLDQDQQIYFCFFRDLRNNGLKTLTNNMFRGMQSLKSL